MLHYLYLDYGGRAAIPAGAEIQPDFAAAGTGRGPGARIAVYTDAPARLCATGRWTVVDIAARIQAWSGGGLYHHRIKPAVVLDALSRFAAPVCFLDSRFHRPARLSCRGRQASRRDLVGTRRGGDEPFREAQSLSAAQGLSHPAAASGRLSLRRADSWMFNSGLIGVTPAHVPLLEDTLALIDALIGRAQEISRHRAVRAVSEVAAAEPDADRRSA